MALNSDTPMYSSHMASRQDAESFFNKKNQGTKN
jgi:hypothetical protein